MPTIGSPPTITPTSTLTKEVALASEPHSSELAFDCSAPEYAISLVLSNGTASHHCFKLKTNAPRRWSVRPNGGVLAPGETAALSIKVMRNSPDFRGIEDDRHLIVSVPVSPAEAAALREQRAAAPRTSPTRPDVNEPGASRTHITPRFASLPPLRPQGAASASPAASPGSAMHSPLPSPLLPSSSLSSPRVPTTAPELQASPPIDANGRLGSVADQVAAIEVRRRPAHDGAALQPNGHHVIGSAKGDIEEAAVAEALGGGGDDDADVDTDADADGASGGRGGVRRGGLLGSLLAFLSAVGDEFTPWLSWKLYDIMFALLMLYLGRRLAWVRRAQELEIL